jgi:hypothetical protein
VVLTSRKSAYLFRNLIPSARPEAFLAMRYSTIFKRGLEFLMEPESELNGGELTRFPGDGHQSLFKRRMECIIEPEYELGGGELAGFPRDGDYPLSLERQQPVAEPPSP